MDLNFKKISKNIYKYVDEYHKAPKKIAINSAKIEMLKPILSQSIHSEIATYIMNNIKGLKKNIKIKKNFDYDNFNSKCIDNLKESNKHANNDDLTYNVRRYTINGKEKFVFSQSIFKYTDTFNLIDNFNKINEIFVKNNLCPKFNYTLLCNSNKELIYLIHVYDNDNDLTSFIKYDFSKVTKKNKEKIFKRFMEIIDILNKNDITYNYIYDIKMCLYIDSSFNLYLIQNYTNNFKFKENEKISPEIYKKFLFTKTYNIENLKNINMYDYVIQQLLNEKHIKY